MREIKFRAWNKRTKEWHGESEPELLTYKGFHIFGECTLLCPPSCDDLINLEITQYTGLKDKNGKEIYEGDIVKIPNDYDIYGMSAGEVYQVYFYAGGFRTKPKYNPESRGGWVEDGDDFEVIGNIYENKELLDE